MEISLFGILGAVLAIVIVVVIVGAVFKVLATVPVPVHPAIPIVVWCAVTVICIFILAWAFGIPIPFVRLR